MLGKCTVVKRNKTLDRLKRHYGCGTFDFIRLGVINNVAYKSLGGEHHNTSDELMSAYRFSFYFAEIVSYVARTIIIVEDTRFYAAKS
ncbi:hypothetical protein LSM04_007409 [Trypanosoma melophagium]|uniref:uncharacterized protein n=1 Tax=Trypanosoma melophagium TaxID=715481 RepID=UPI00351A2BBD|nr:hypothetical protein LSM04_007409 [Trypanosoma melophagium]